MEQVRSPHINYEELKGIITALGPYRYFVTITFQYMTSDAEGIRHMSTILKRLQRRLFGNKWKSRVAMSGIAILEHACIQPGNLGMIESCHFHLLIRDDPRFDRDCRAGFRQLRLALKGVMSGLKHSNGKTLIGRRATKIKFVRDSGVDGYVSKEARKFKWDISNSFFPIGHDGIGSPI